nr:hypothetical protein [Tanacetum cinerariifolium]
METSRGMLVSQEFVDVTKPVELEKEELEKEVKDMEFLHISYQAFDRTLRDICTSTCTWNSDKVFRGKVVVFGGDL